MHKWLAFLITLALGSVLSAVVSGRFTVLRILGQAIMFAALFGPMYLAPHRYARWMARCRVPWRRRRA